MRQTFRQAKWIVTTSQQTQALIPRRFWQKVGIQLAIGITSQIATRPARRQPHQPFSLIYVGRFLEWKGMHLGLAAFALVLQQRNLNTITPPDMNFEIVSGGNSTMREGQIIEYRVEFVRGVRSAWLTEIAHVREGEYFVDEQRVGPYRFWYHEHCFEPAEAGVKMTDRVTYSVPYGILGGRPESPVDPRTARRRFSSTAA